MTEEESKLSKYKKLNDWGLPILIAALASTYEYTLQKKIGNITSTTYLRCLAAGTLGFLFTKYVFNTIFSRQMEAIKITAKKNNLEFVKI